MTKPTRRPASNHLDDQLLRAVRGGVASSVQKKADDTAGPIVDKIG